MRNVTRREFGSLAAGISAATFIRPAFAQSAEGPIRIGYTMPLSGGLAGNGRPAFLAHKLWVEDVNAKGGLLGRMVELVNYDDQSNAGQVPALYTKLIEVDKVDLVVSSYSTALIAPAMPVIMGHGMAFVTLLGSATNDAFQYDRTVNVSPTGGNMQQDFAKGFFEVAMSADPKPKTVAIAGLDSDFLQRSMKSARTQAKAAGLEILYDKSYPPSTVDYGPIRPGDPGRKAGHCLSRLLPHQLSRLSQSDIRGQALGDRSRRRHDRAPDHRDQGAVAAHAQQPLVLGRLFSPSQRRSSRGSRPSLNATAPPPRRRRRTRSDFTRRRSPMRRCK